MPEAARAAPAHWTARLPWWTRGPIAAALALAVMWGVWTADRLVHLNRRKTVGGAVFALALANVVAADVGRRRTRWGGAATALAVFAALEAVLLTSSGGGDLSLPVVLWITGTGAAIGARVARDGPALRMRRGLVSMAGAIGAALFWMILVRNPRLSAIGVPEVAAGCELAFWLPLAGLEAIAFRVALGRARVKPT